MNNELVYRDIDWNDAEGKKLDIKWLLFDFNTAEFDPEEINNVDHSIMDEETW
jgi:hypothetical protein